MSAARAVVANDGRLADRIAQAIDRMIFGDFSDAEELSELTPELRQKFIQLRDAFAHRLKAAHDLGERDPTTGVLSRHSFRFAIAARFAESSAERTGVMFFCNVDGFKRFNDLLGTANADRLLAQIAMRIRFTVAAIGVIKSQWLVGRLWGDEIAFYIEDMDRAAAVRCARAIQSALSEPFFIHEEGIAATACIGMACRPNDGVGHDVLLRHAELAMRRAKLVGRGAVRLFDGSEQADAEAAVVLESSLDQALLHDQFHLVYQPQVEARDVGRVVGVEALLRWHHPERGPIGPEIFIPLAERRGLIGNIGRWVIAQALSASARWLRQGIACRMSVNLSPVELMRDDLVGHIHEWLTRTGVPPAMFEVEVTESTAFASGGQAGKRLAALRAMGVGVAMDDFGAGYSSLARLTEMPFDRLKIDRSLVEDILDREDRRMVLDCVVGLARTLGQQVVVEGVERSEQISLLSDMSCDLLQGYVISPPLKEDALLAWLHSRTTDRVARD